MNEEIEYAEMLEIPVSTINVVRKQRKRKKGELTPLPTEKTEEPTAIKDSVIASVNERVSADVEEGSGSSIDLPFLCLFGYSEGVLCFLHGIGVELAVDVEIFRGVERSKLRNGHLVGGHGLYIRFRQLFLILAALDSPRNGNFVPHRQIFDKAGVPAPSDTRDVV